MRTPRPIAAVLTAASFALLASPCGGQVLIGRLMASTGNQPIEGAQLILVPDDGRDTAVAVTARDGSFTLAAPNSGVYALRVRAAGYSVVETPWFWLRLGRSYAPEVELLPVTGRKPGTRILTSGLPGIDWVRGFEQRRVRAWGAFRDREEIVAMAPHLATDALRGIPGLAILAEDRGFGYHDQVVSSKPPLTPRAALAMRAVARTAAFKSGAGNPST